MDSKGLTFIGMASNRSLAYPFVSRSSASIRARVRLRMGHVGNDKILMEGRAGWLGQRLDMNRTYR